MAKHRSSFRHPCLRRRRRSAPSLPERLRDERGYLMVALLVAMSVMAIMMGAALPAWLGPGPFDAFFLPINGRDPARGVPGNMTAAEAVALAARCRPRFVVPHHYDLFTFNTVPVSTFEAEARRLPEGVTPRVLRCGERWEIPGVGADTVLP